MKIFRNPAIVSLNGRDLLAKKAPEPAQKLARTQTQVQGEAPTIEKGQEAESFNLGFLEFLSEGVIVINAARQIAGVNSAFEKLLGWTAAELVGQPCRLFFGCQDPRTGTGFCESMCPLAELHLHPSVFFSEKDEVHYKDLTVTHKNGQRLIVNASLSPLELAFPDKKGAGQDNFSVMVLRNVTETKRQERIQSEFVTAASHQLRTPLASIKTSTGLLLDNTGSDFNPTLQKLLKNIQTSSLRMERLVNDLIELVSLQNGQVKMQIQQIEAQELVYQALKLNRHRLAERNQTAKPVLPSRPLYVRADLLRMSQVLGHLLSNASKFSQPGQQIVLKIKAQPDTSEVIFSVRDEGIGIAPEEQPFIFEKFYQSQVVENSVGQGAGLGLPLAKVLIELNGGRLWFESIPGKGSTFFFSLPSVGETSV